jgi:hypothetical protein
VVAAFERSAPAGARFTQISFYRDAAVALVHPAGASSQQYVWRAGRLAGSTPRTAPGEPDELGFAAADVDWHAIAGLAGRAAALTGVEGGTVTHVIVDRSPFDPTLPITIRVSVAGPTGAGFVEASASGQILAVY